MVLCRKPLILLIDALGAAGVLVLLLLTACLVVMPYSRQHWRVPQLQGQISHARRLLDRLAAQNAAIATWIDANEQRLREQADPLLADVGTFLEELANECRAGGIMLEQFEPVSVAAPADQPYQSWDVHVRARGSFPQFARLLARIESRSPYVYVRELDVEGPGPGTTGRAESCRVSWTVRVHYLPTTRTSGAPNAAATIPSLAGGPFRGAPP